MTTPQAIAEMMKNWTAAEANARAQFPTASDEEIYQLVSAAMNRSLRLACN